VQDVSDHMGTRWLCAPGLLTDSTRAVYETQPKEAEKFPATSADPWRTWLITGNRLVPLDLRRARGAQGWLMKTLTDEPHTSGSKPWKDLTSAMDRQAVGEALNALPDEQKQVVKLAYFGGLTNRDIADRLDLPVSGVRRRLRQALATVSAHVEQGRAAGSRVVYAFTAWICGRWLYSTQRWSGNGVEQVVRAGMVVAAGVTASVVLGTAQSPVRLAPIDHATIPAVRSGDASMAPAPKVIPSATGTLLPTASVGGTLVPRSGVPSLPLTVQVPSLPDVRVTVPAPALPISVPIPTPAVPALPKL
jgi:RNA polymerase sigma factor (sigma-70 family)